MTAGALGVVKAIAKSPMPPLQKAGLVVGSAAGAGLFNVGISVFKDAFSKNASATTTASSTINNNNVSKFLGDTQGSPLQDILWVIEALDYVLLSMIYILIVQLIYKLYVKDNVSLSSFKLLSNNLNNKIEFYLNKIIKLNKQMSVFWIWYGIIIVICGIIGSIYLIYGVYTNISHFISLHNSVNNNIIPTAYESIQNALFNLKITNYIALAILITLGIILLYRFNFYKKINNIYIWILLIVLIITLAYSAYISHELYTNIDSYVFLYNSLIK